MGMTQSLIRGADAKSKPGWTMKSLIRRMAPKLEANPTQEKEFLVEDDIKSDPHMHTCNRGHKPKGHLPYPNRGPVEASVETTQSQSQSRG